MTLDEFHAALKALGYDVPAAALEEVHPMLPNLQAMRRRVRRGYPREAEPAHTFSPVAGAMVPQEAER